MIVSVSDYPRFYGRNERSDYDILYMVPKAGASVHYVSVGARLRPEPKLCEDRLTTYLGYSEIEEPNWARMARTWGWSAAKLAQIKEDINDCCRS